MFETGVEKAYAPKPVVDACVVIGGAGTRYDCFGGDDESERSTLTYVSYESPRVDSGTQARRSLFEATDWVDCEEVGRS